MDLLSGSQLTQSIHIHLSNFKNSGIASSGLSIGSKYNGHSLFRQLIDFLFALLDFLDEILRLNVLQGFFQGLTVGLVSKVGSNLFKGDGLSVIDDHGEDGIFLGKLFLFESFFHVSDRRAIFFRWRG